MKEALKHALSQDYKDDGNVVNALTLIESSLLNEEGAANRKIVRYLLEGGEQGADVFGYLDDVIMRGVSGEIALQVVQVLITLCEIMEGNGLGYFNRLENLNLPK